MTEDPSWPRASSWLSAEVDATSAGQVADLAVIGVPAYRTSISPTGAHATPAAVRGALARYSTWSWAHAIDVTTVVALDAGDVDEPDFEEGEARVRDAVAPLASTALVFAIGGDNSITHSVCAGLWGPAIADAGLITVDAHHDLRDGVSNGSPVRRLIEAGLRSDRVVQIGINDFSNSAEYAARARDLGITVITRAMLRNRSMADVMIEALTIAGAGRGPIHVDLDVDACDRAVVPACPAAAPGGLSADELRQLAFAAGRSPSVRSMDITEIDATADAADQRTIRLGALCLLEAACGLALRRKAARDLV
jgi:formiminoglutamase